MRYKPPRPSSTLPRIWRNSDSLLINNELMLIWMGFNKTGCFHGCALRITANGWCLLKQVEGSAPGTHAYPSTMRDAEPGLSS